MTGVVRSRAPLLLFGLSIMAIYAVALSVVARLPRLDDPDLISGALTLDLTLLVPLLYYLLVVRWLGWPAITVLPVFLASVLVAGRLIPKEQHHVLDLIGYAAAAAELAVVAVIAYKAIQIRREVRSRTKAGEDVYESLRASGRSVLGPVAGGVLAYEAAVFYYAFAGWRRQAEANDKTFTVYRNTGYAGLMIAVTLVLVMETFGVHMLVRLWSDAAAWVLTGLSLYALVWMIGDFQAVRLRAVRIVDETLHLRMGLRWTVEIPLASVRGVHALKGDEAPAGKEYLKAVLIGTPNRRLELVEPVTAVGPYGYTRRVKVIDLQIDGAARFDATLG